MLYNRQGYYYLINDFLFEAAWSSGKSAELVEEAMW